MLQVLWLTSWYPNRSDLYNGDFVQRHAIAASAYCRLQVLHAELVARDFQVQQLVRTVAQQPLFTETILYIRQSALPWPLNKIINQYRYEKYLKQEVNRYLKEHGLPQLVHVHIPVKAGKIALWFKRKYRVPYVLTEHYGIYNNLAPDRFRFRSWWFRSLTRRVLAGAAAFLPVSKSLGDAVNEWVAEKPFQVVYNVVDTDLFCYKPVQKRTDAFYFVHVSTMNHPKNPEGLLRSFAAACRPQPGLKLVMIGPVPEAVVAAAAAQGLADQVVFTGLLPQPEVAEWLHQAHAFVLFSNYETMSCSTAEALCCGLPVISTDVGGIPDFVTGADGIVVGVADEPALTRAMRQMVQAYSGYRPAAIGARATALFGYAPVGQQLEAVYEKVVRNSSPSGRVPGKQEGRSKLPV